MKLLKGLGIALVLFYMVIFIGVNFVTVGVEEPKPVQKEPSEYLKQEIQLEDAKILGKFWNDKGHFIVVYRDTTKAPEIVEVDASEWELMEVGVNFVTVGVGSKEETKTVQRESLGFQESKLRAKLEDATILGKFWNRKGHFIVVYNGTTKAPEIIEVNYSDWQLMDIGELY
ncbi:hypothetical protein [Streptococcus thalassemiae]|uniref:hypothetical protein n=1 Tax=Streptococcus thalassemiae TaxID=2736608 RepID=UPI00158D424B|nr:hypothetical protein [Streptococcus thalassemiae]